MNFRPRPAKRFLSLFLAWSAAMALPTAFSGCLGGTTTEGGNPEITLEFRENGNSQAFSGVLMIFAKDANPLFRNPDPDDGGTPPKGGYVDPDAGVADLVIPVSRSVTLDLELLSGSLHRQPVLRLGKTSAAAGTAAAAVSKPVPLPDFNIVFIANGGKMSILSGIHLTESPARFVTQDGGPGGLQIMDVAPWRDYAGSVDTTTEAGKPVALFVPGTNFFAKVRNGKFIFEDLPDALMPLRWVSAAGIVRTMPDSLGRIWTKPLRPGERVDSIPMPDPMVEVQLPSATPPGHFAFTDSVSVVLSSEPGAAIYYTLDGSTPDNGSALYAAPLLLRSSATLKSIAYIKGRDHSAVSVNNYTLVPMEPVASPAGKGFRDSILVSLASPYSDAVLFYTLDGADPGANSTRYSGEPILITSSTTIKAIADVPGLGQSRVLAEKYILVTDSLP